MTEYIDKLHIGGKDYDISAASADKALSASNAEKLQGLEASTFASASDLTTLAGRVTTAENNITTLQGYFDGDTAKKATSATIAAAATSAAAADALKNSVSLNATGDATVTFDAFNGSNSSVTGTVSIPHPVSLTPASGSTTTGFATASATEKALADVIKQVDGIGAYEVVPADAKGEPVVDSPSKKIIYLTKIEGKTPDAYKEWIYTGTKFELIGETTIDLTHYVQDSDETYTATVAYAADWNNNATAVKAAVTDVATLKTASANWDTASTWVNTNGNNVTAHLADTGIHVTTTQKAAWNAASAWVDANSGLVLKEVSATDSVSGKGTAASPIGLTTTAEDALAAVAGKLDTTAAAQTYLTKSDASATYATKTAFDTLNDTVNNSTSGLVKKVGDNTAAIAQNATNIGAVSSTVAGMKYYGKIRIGSKTTTASAAADTFEIAAGDGIDVSAAQNGEGNPTIVISNTAVAPTFIGKNGISVTSAGNEWTISGNVATSADDGYGVTRASYVSGSTAFIF